jgi:hypothetical protein
MLKLHNKCLLNESCFVFRNARHVLMLILTKRLTKRMLCKWPLLSLGLILRESFLLTEILLVEKPSHMKTLLPSWSVSESINSKTQHQPILLSEKILLVENQSHMKTMLPRWQVSESINSTPQHLSWHLRKWITTSLCNYYCMFYKMLLFL